MLYIFDCRQANGDNQQAITMTNPTNNFVTDFAEYSTSRSVKSKFGGRSMSNLLLDVLAAIQPHLILQLAAITSQYSK